MSRDRDDWGVRGLRNKADIFRVIDQLKKNPVMSADELNSISGGLGDEAMEQFGGGKGGLGAMLGVR